MVESRARGPWLRIVSVNDVYILDNLPRLATLIARAKEGPDTTLVVLAGDFVAPSLLSSLDSGRGMVDCMNAVGVTHVVLGNHEDDIDIAELHARIAELDGICLGTNVRGFTPELPVRDVVAVRGPTRELRVGLVGVVMDDPTAYRRVPFGARQLLPPNDAALAEAARLVDDGAAVVVAITHQSMSADRALAAAEGRIPVVLGGHEHTVTIENVAPDGPTGAHGPWIVKAGSDAVHAAIIDLTWEDGANATTRDDRPTVHVKLDDTAAYEEDGAVRRRVDEHMAKVAALETSILAKLGAGVELSSIGTRARQTTMGTFVCSTLRDALGADGCLFNGGGIRGARVHREHLTYGDLKTEVPFDNEVVVVPLPGQVIADAIAVTRSRAPVEYGGFLQVDDRMSVGDDHVLRAIAGAPLDPARIYRIAIVRDLFGGLDRIEPLRTFAERFPEKICPSGCGREAKLVLVDRLAIDLWKTLGHFDTIDEDHDGSVTPSEVVHAIERTTGAPGSPVTADLVVRALDTDHDGKVSRDEADAVPK